MSNNREVYYYIFGLLLLDYALAEGTCDRGTCLGQRNFGHILPRSAFMTRFQVSFYQCATECLLRKQRCKSFNYRRIYPSCQLCEEDSGQGGENLQPEHDSIHSNIATWKNIPVGYCNDINCSWNQRCDPSSLDPKTACVVSDCPYPEIRPGVTIDPSNETSVGTHVWQRCDLRSMERGNRITTCIETTAEWSVTDFKCVCKAPPVIRGTLNATEEMEVGQTYTYRCKDGLVGNRYENPTITCLRDGQWTATNFTCVCPIPPTKLGVINEVAAVEVGQNYTYRCQPGLFKKGDGNSTVTCLPNGRWTSTNFICVQQNWTQDTIYPNNIHTSEVISDQTGIHLLECMQRCDNNQTDCFSFFYDNFNNRCVLSSSFRRGTPQGFQISAGLVYYTAPSASCDMGYSNVSLGGSYFCIKIHNSGQTFHEGMKTCESEKAKLLVVTTEAQITDANNLLRDVNDYAYIGVSDETNEGHWVSWKGEEVSIFWYSSASSTTISDSTHNCGTMHHMLIGVLNHECYHKHSFVCCRNDL
ncbi:hypothetical protein CHS0354_002846 [Potamilus streckersoni]|uniref:Uncharacterized protein n=1 Tax=Potamilus streckersoni TaxID=2493646 RepID=A0AAE0VYN9_9BIVA|nr:hypothetical protein CHS0354_002846 [Potamilus streckersoni]